MPEIYEEITEKLPRRGERSRKNSRKFLDNSSGSPAFFTASKQSVSPAQKGASRNRLKQGIPPSEQPVPFKFGSLGIEGMDEEDYIASPHDKPHLFKVRPVHLLKEFSGQGLFAVEDIPAEVCFGQYTGEVCSGDEDYLEKDNSYAFEVGGKFVDAIKKGNFTRFINFSDTRANAAFALGPLVRKGEVLLKTIRPVKAGEQLLVDYNTYDPQRSSKYIFLNPEDGWISTEKMYQEQLKYYMPKWFIFDPERMNDNRGYITVIGERILNYTSLESLGNEYDATVNLPYLELSESGEIIDATETDLCTPLMKACQLGQVENVQWLIKHGASINQQQNHTGNCSLFLALQGYHLEEERKPLYMDVIKKLIELKVSLRVYNRKDQTFLHQAISILNPSDFKEIISLIALYPEQDFLDLFNYLDNENNDIISVCIQSKRFEHLSTLLKAYPHYFNDHYFKGPLEDRKNNFERLKLAISSCSDESKETLINLLMKLNIKRTPKILESIDLSYPAALLSPRQR
jgi:hypothetical protein